MRDAQPQAIRLADYQPASFAIRNVELEFELFSDKTLVTSTLTIERTRADHSALVLDGQELTLLSVELDGLILDASDYQLTPDQLIIASPPDHFTLRTVVEIHPERNTSLEGLYRSRTMFCTQCEAEGFRKITYYLDRPDVMSIFTVRITADQEQYPVLLSNGNQIGAETLDHGRHSVTWHDPHKKPAYLFALVAGDLAHIEDRFTTMSGRDVVLRIFVEPKDLDKCDFGMGALKRSMLWDEQKYGREYDLELLNIVAVDDFNMGAMENKSLNIFNTSCVLASPDVTTDQGYQRVEAIIAHEYFHNWSGNRVTCRDWFQLSLKEGFTVFRDSQFSADMGSEAVKRIEDVVLLRTAQFAEDAGPMSHPVRPDSYIEISNFYTLTVYEKGAEVVRMLHTLLGEDRFRAGSDLYFDRHDGQAVTCDDFVAAMEAVSGYDLSQFKRWYSQSGTPVVTAATDYDKEQRTLTLMLTQSCPATPGQPTKQPFDIPILMGLVGAKNTLPIISNSEGVEVRSSTEVLLRLTQSEQRFVFEQVDEPAIASLLRGFSAPVRCNQSLTVDQLVTLICNESDGFLRWDALQTLAVQAIEETQSGSTSEALPALIGGLRNLLEKEEDPAIVAVSLVLPSENYLAELHSQKGGADPIGLHLAREGVKVAIAKALYDTLLRLAAAPTHATYEADGAGIAARSLRHTALDYVRMVEGTQAADIALRLLESADNLSDRLAALRTLSYVGGKRADAAIASFYQRFSDEPLVVNQWFQLQAMNPYGNAIDRVKSLLAHPAYDPLNPNKVRSVIGAFSQANPVQFHSTDGQGYALLADIVIELNEKNPQIASRLLAPLTKWRTYPAQSAAMRAELERIASQATLSKDVFEVVSKSLAV